MRISDAIVRRAGRVLFLAALLVTSLPQIGPARAQDDELDTDLLFRIELEQGVLPVAPAFVRLVRIILEPGATSPAHTHTGPEFGRVEAGTLTVQVGGPALVKRLDADGDEFEAVDSDSPFDLERGEQIAYLPGTPMTLTNNSDETVRVLAAVILPAEENAGPRIDYVDGEPDEAALEGVSSQVLGDGVARTLPTGGASIVIERVRLTDEQDLPGEANPTLLSLEDGNFAFDLEAGTAQVSRTAKPGPQADLSEGDDTSLEKRDAIYFPNGFRTVNREGQEDGLTYLRMIIGPSSDEEQLSDEGKATISFNKVRAETEETPTSDGAADDDGEAETSTVYVNSFDVNLRAEPSTGSAIVATYQTGQALTLTGDAVEAEGIRWFPVTNPDDGLSGFISAQLLSRQPDGSEPL